jgi:hypothetical protein
VKEQQILPPFNENDICRGLSDHEVDALIHGVGACPAPGWSGAPYEAKLTACGWGMVVNAHGANALRFPTKKPGAVFTDFETAREIAEHWNKAANHA